MALPVTLSARCAVALPPSGCLFDQGVTTFWRRGVAYGSPMEIVPAEFSTRSLSSPPCSPHVALDAVRVFERIANQVPVLPLLLCGRELAALGSQTCPRPGSSSSADAPSLALGRGHPALVLSCFPLSMMAAHKAVAYCGRRIDRPGRAALASTIASVRCNAARCRISRWAGSGAFLAFCNKSFARLRCGVAVIMGASWGDGAIESAE
jgi:hypothetical protein